MAGSDFQLVGPLFERIEAVTQTYVTDISSRIITEITPVVSVGLTVGFIAYGMLIMRGAVEMPVADFLQRCLRIGIIVSIAVAGGLYQSQIADAIMAAPDALAQAISGNAGGVSAANVIDASAQQGADYVSKAFEKAGVFKANGLVYAAIGSIAALALTAIVGVGAVFLIAAKVALAILVGLGPLFILGLLWQSTSRFFEQWMHQLLNYVLLIVLFSTVFMLLMDIYQDYMAQAAFDGVQNVSYTLIGMLLISIVSLGLLLQLPNIASGLAGGVGISYWYELRAIRSGARGAYAAGKAGAKMAAHGAAAVARGGVAAAQAGTKAVRAVAGYFRGRRS